MTAVIRDKSGQKIASVELCPANGAQTISIERVLEGKGTLLHYYFGRGGRQVTIESEMEQWQGTLKTNWAKNERKWRVELDAAATSAAEELAVQRAS